MTHKHQRFSLKTKEAKQIISQVSEKLKIDLESVFGSKINVEVVEADFGQLLLLRGKPALFRKKETFLPTLTSNELLKALPKVVVDMGAVRFVCNGADVMAPGIVRYEGEFGANDITVVIDEKHNKPLAIGEVLYNSNEVKNVKQGVIVKNLHYVGDKVWNFTKLIG
ncbi:MAG: DUF1947 domain-containing protein [Candidatus Bathyarchaeota archaeon]|nr:DUF1947 domain-containing protein [Candidatus Bathyarchaeota archaeon]